ncbi:unnamed protein product [Chrysodeixis includens]|uniref:Innexin n=1 Tax=Chrysodeixis includens TaxID=689277 RepID=A0A9N8KQ50_CHRIL|nr:unnamed protein product [Chrysodeixis includens]
MFKLLGGLSVYFKYQPIRTDNAVFRLHNVFTTVLLLTCSMIITATQYVGQPIQCIVSGLPVNVVNTFCWITSTFTMPDAFAREVGKEVAHPGIANEYDSSQDKKYYTYYQWVCFVLFFQAIMCYTPKFLWDAFEGGLLRTIVMGLNIGICHPDEKEKKKDVLIEYLIRHERAVLAVSLSVVQPFPIEFAIHKLRLLATSGNRGSCRGCVSCLHNACLHGFAATHWNSIGVRCA